MIQIQDIKKFNSVFSSSVLKDIANHRKSKRINSLIKETNTEYLFNSCNFRTFFEKIFNLLVENYRSEYIYKSAIINKLISGRHSVKNSSMFSEFAVGESIADVAFFNGTSTVYEIKTEYDDFTRIHRQINSYKKVFERIYVVTHKSQTQNLLSLIDSDIGIIELTDNFSIKIINESKSHLDTIENESIFRCLRKNEYLSLVKKYYGYEPDISNFKIYDVCLELLKHIDTNVLHEDYVTLLRYRNSSQKFKDFFNDLPLSLKALGTFTNYTDREKIGLINSLECSIL